LSTDTQSDDNISFFIEEMLGDSHVSFEYLLILSIIYSIFLIVGVFGNLSTCMVIISNEYMRTTTNIFLLNLAIADLATLIISKKCTLLNCNIVAIGSAIKFHSSANRLQLSALSVQPSANSTNVGCMVLKDFDWIYGFNAAARG
jgi:hypothetical protein